MKKFRFIILLLIPLLLLNQIAYAVSIPEPEVLSTPEENIPVEIVKKGGSGWLWILLLIVVAGGAAVAVGGKGGSSTEKAPTIK